MPITAYCDQCRLDVVQRLELFIQVCHAIQHAHQKGIVHRDIKPSNVIIAQVGGVAVPKVIDFGIAKAVSGQSLCDNTQFTAMEQFVGTPAYMSPEQADMAEMDIDVRSDIYSLGVLLYELLAGKTPFSQKELIRSGLEKMRRTIRDVEPPRPSARLVELSEADLGTIAETRGLTPARLLNWLGGDLDWIAMKALEKDRERRYRSADGLSDDIQRCLNHEPVIARPPSRIYRLRKLVRRNKVVFAAGALTAIVLVMSSTVSTVLLVKERTAHLRAVQAEREKGELQKETESLRSSVEHLAEASVLLRQGDNEQADALLDRIEMPQASLENASIYRRLGDWHALNGRWEKAKARFEVLTRINEFEGVESTADDVRFASLLVEQGFLEEYELFREAIIMRYAGSENPKVAQRVLQHCLLVPAGKELMLALSQYARVSELSLQKDNTSSNPQRGWEVSTLAFYSYRRGDWQQALYWCDDAYVDGGKLPTRDLNIRLVRALATFRYGRHEEARSQLDAIRADVKRIFSEDPSTSRLWQGFWFDQAGVRILLDEACSVIEAGAAE